jgi:hypothetical protein
MDKVEKGANKTGFFAVCIDECKTILLQGGGFDALASYLIIAKHTAGKAPGISTPHRYSTAGIHSIEKRAGISRTRANKAVDWLVSNEFLAHYVDVESKNVRVTQKKMQLRYVVDYGPRPQWLYMSHTFIDGFKKTPDTVAPLARIYNEARVAFDHNAKTQRAITLWLSLQLMRNHSLQDFGGVDPRVIRSNMTTEKVSDFNLGSGKWSCYAAKNNGVHSTTDAFMESVISPFRFSCLSSVPEEEMKRAEEIFWGAFEEVKRHGFVYKVIQIWEDDPLSDGSEAEIAYPLYVYGNTSDPSLSRIFNRVIMDNYGDWSSSNEDDSGGITEQLFSDENTFHYYGLENYVPIVSYRFRFRSSDSDSGRGIEAQKRAVDKYHEPLKKAGLIKN